MNALEEIAENEKKICKARDRLLHGSQACTNPRHCNWDLCKEHGRQMHPHILIDGTLYMNVRDGSDE